MPALGILFNDYKAYPQPKRVYCDSNFALQVFHHVVFHGYPAKLKPLDTACHAFYQQLKGDGVDIIASLLTYTEVMHVYCFHLPGGMKDKTASFLRSKGDPVPPNPQEAFKTFIKKYPTDAEAIWKSLQYRVEAVDDFFGQYVRLLSPLPSPTLSNITKSVADFASILNSFYVAIESNDSLHLSLATYLAADAVVSLDRAFLNVDNFTIYWTS